MPTIIAETIKSEHNPSIEAHSLCCGTFHFPRYHNPDEIASRPDVGVLQKVGRNRSNYTVSQPTNAEPKTAHAESQIIQLTNNEHQSYAISPVEHTFPFQQGALQLYATNKNTPSFICF